jgi:hypothetical protein
MLQVAGKRKNGVLLYCYILKWDCSLYKNYIMVVFEYVTEINNLAVLFVLIE